MIIRLLKNGVDRKSWIFLTILFAVTLGVSILNLAPTPGSTLHLSSFVVTVLGKYLT